MPLDLFINGKRTPPAGGKYFAVVNPATEEKVDDVAEGTTADIDAAVAAAQAAFVGPWAKMAAADRGRLLWKLGDALWDKADDFAKTETLNTGKPIFESKNVEIALCAEVLRFYAGQATKITGDTIPVRGDFLCYTRREPVGVVGAITPWNFPLLLAIWKIAPALAAGNCVVHKPASWTPLTALKFAELAKEVGLPDGVLNCVTGPGSTLGPHLTRHAGVDKIAFTGETGTGKEIMRNASEGLKRLSLELGGKSPNIVFEDADLEAAARGAITGIFYNKGEVCSAGSRLFVSEKVHGPLMEKLVEKTKKLKLGDPFAKDTRMGPVVAKRQMDTVLSYIESGKKDGARAVTGGGRAPELPKGYFVTPTIFEGVTNQMKIAREEIFGPVLSVIRFSDFEDVIKQSNDTFYGLAAGVWTRDVAKAHKAAALLKAGTVWVNAYNMFDAAAPFGGYKQSGFGRELGEGAIDHYTELKTVWVNLA